MPEVELVSEIVGGAKSLGVIAGAHWLLRGLLGGSVDAIGNEITSYVELKLKNLKTVLAKSETIVEAKGIKVEAVPPKLLQPILEGASLEEDALLQDAWAAMIANMADSSKNFRNTIFPYLLGQLSREEWAFLINEFEQGSSLLKLLKNFEANTPSFNQGDREYEESCVKINKMYYSQLKTKDARNNIKNVFYEQLSIILNKRNDLPEYLLDNLHDAAIIVDDNKINEIQMQNLLRLGIIKIATDTDIEGGSNTITDGYTGEDYCIDYIENVSIFDYPVITRLGMELIECCIINT